MYVLVSGPLVEDVDRAVLEEGRQQGEAFPLSLGQRNGRKRAVRNLHFCVELELDQVARSARVEIRMAETEQAIE